MGERLSSTMLGRPGIQARRKKIFSLRGLRDFFGVGSLIIFCAITLSACGQSGPLYLPQDTQAQPNK